MFKHYLRLRIHADVACHRVLLQGLNVRQGYRGTGPLRFFTRLQLGHPRRTLDASCSSYTRGVPDIVRESWKPLLLARGRALPPLSSLTLA